MNVPVFIINGVSLLIAALIGVIFRTTIMGKMAAQEKASNLRMDGIEKDIKEWHAKEETAIERIAASLTPRAHCDARQEIWEIRFRSLQTESKLEHAGIEKSLVGFENTMKGMTDMLQEASECIQKLASGAKDCKK